MEEFTPLPSMMAVMQHELSVVCEPANDLGTVKIPEMLPGKNENAYTFFSFLPCYVTMERFIDDVLTLSGCRYEVFICALIILERAQKRDARLKISTYTVVRLFTAAIVVARKAVNQYTPGDNMLIYTDYWRPSENMMRQNELALLNVHNCNVSVSDEEIRQRLKVARDRIH